MSGRSQLGFGIEWSGGGALLNEPRDSGSEGLSGHIGLAFDGRSEFEAIAISFLGAGRAKGEKLIFVCDEPNPSAWPSEWVASGALHLASIREVYGSEVQADQQRRSFTSTLEEALKEGYSGIRVAADNSSLVTTPSQARAWMAWEVIADDFMAESPVTGMCGFDRKRLQPQFIRFITGIHPTVI